MLPIHEESADAMRARLVEGGVPPDVFRATLAGLPLLERDAWLDRVLGLEDIPDDGPALPRGGVPYLPCPVHALLEAVDTAAIGPEDVVIDIGAGVGRALAAVRLLTGASGVGIEVQPALVDAARALSGRFGWGDIDWVRGDAVDHLGAMGGGTVFMLYCPFGGERLDRVLAALERIARSRPIRVVCVDMPPLGRPWLVPVPAEDVTVYRSR